QSIKKLESLGYKVTVESVADPEIRELMSRVSLVPDGELEAGHPARWPSVVEITTRSGRIYRGRTDFPKGDPENPVTAGELAAKFRALAEGPWGEEKAKALEKTVLELEKVENVGIIF
ncbi:MAG TPA: hypothetical protein PK728_05000, partial [Bacillota bacterium]|nr:hypothetical protein [Bacillota bacterium]